MEKYAKKNPGKYHKLEAPPPSSSGHRRRHSGEDDDYLGGFTEHFSRGMNKLMSFADDDEPRHHRHRSRDGDMPRIQLTRRYAEENHVTPSLSDMV